VACAIALPPAAASGQTVSASASVNGGTIIRPTGTPTAGATASTLAAAKAFHGGESYQFNGAAAPVAETTVLESLMKQAQGTARVFNAQQRFGAISKFNKDLRAGTAPQAGTFGLVSKVNGMSSTGGPVQSLGNPVAESASAFASQNQSNGVCRFTDSSVTSAKATKDVPSADAVAFTVNRDPIGITWDSPGIRSLTFDLSQASIQVQTQGLGSGAIGALAINAGYIDGTTDVTQPESSASPILSLLLAVGETDGGAATLLTDESFLTTAGSVTDSLGDSGLQAVQNGLLNDLMVSPDGTVSFVQPYSITATVPGTDSQSLLFLSERTFAESMAVPEPSTLVLAGIGCGILVVVKTLQRRRALDRVRDGPSGRPRSCDGASQSESIRRAGHAACGTIRSESLRPWSPGAPTMMVAFGRKMRDWLLAAGLALALSFTAGCHEEEEAPTSAPPSTLPTSDISHPVPPPAPRTDQGGETKDVGRLGRDLGKDQAAPLIEPGGPTSTFPPPAKPDSAKPDDATKPGQP
jgi:hypothetical protein